MNTCFRRIGVVTVAGMASLALCQYSSGMDGMWVMPESPPGSAQQCSLDGLLADLRSDDPTELRATLNTLWRMGPEAADAVDVLAAMLDDDWTIEAKHWIVALKDRAWWVRIIAARQLARVTPAQNASVIGALVTALQDDSPNVREEVAKALGQIGTTACVDPLIDAFSDSNWNVGVAAARALAEIGEPAMEALLNRLPDLDESGRRRAVLAIQYSDPDRMRDLYLQGLKSEHGDVRAGFLYAAIQHKLPEALGLAEAMVHDADPGVRRTVVRGLGVLTDEHTASSVHPLLLQAMADDPDPGVRSGAIWRLYFLPGEPPEDFWRHIAAAMEDASPRVRELAATAAGKFWDERLAAGLLKLIEDADLRCVDTAARALGRIGTDRAVNALIQRFRDRQANHDRRFAVLVGLSHTSNRKAIGSLIDAMEEGVDAKSRDVRDALTRFAGQDLGRSVPAWRKWWAGEPDGPVLSQGRR